MAEVNKKNNTKTIKTSKVQGKSVKKKEVSQLSNDELLEQILNKKKNKSVKNSTTVVKKKSSSKKNNSVNKVDNISNDELYEIIKAKKKKKTATVKKDSKKENPITISTQSAVSFLVSSGGVPACFPVCPLMAKAYCLPLYW